MHLDIIIPTYNRCAFLLAALQSLRAARVPAGHSVAVTVVDNNSTDATRAVVESESLAWNGSLRYLFEETPGVSSARNAGIAATSGDYFGFVDDDETVTEGWIEAAFSAFEKYPQSSFFSGPYEPNWETHPPHWLPPGYPAVVGWIPGPGCEVPLGPASGMSLLGGNCLFRRADLGSAAYFDAGLGRYPLGLGSSEDDDLFVRLTAKGLTGMWIPGLTIRHWIPASRCTRRYHRHWSFGKGVSDGLRWRVQAPAGPTLLGLPRWLFRAAAEGLLSALRYRLSDEARSLAGELKCWTLAGMLYGRWKRIAPHSG